MIPRVDKAALYTNVAVWAQWLKFPNGLICTTVSLSLLLEGRLAEAAGLGPCSLPSGPPKVASWVARSKKECSK